jgi:hypothetical protein
MRTSILWWRAVSVTPLYTDVVLDDAAVQAERLALLVELTAERFGHAQAHPSVCDDLTGLAAARHLERAASLAREAADRERTRCAATYSGTGSASPSSALSLGSA